MQFNGYAAHGPQETLSTHEYDDTLDDNDVAVQITHCGICHSDLHLIDGEMPMGDFPFIPGHEIVGTITSTGSHVTALNEGDRVGVGWQCNSCKECEWCLDGEQHNCPEQQATCVGRNGGYADGIIVDKDFAIPVPENVSSESAAPMMCGGITVYTPLSKYAEPGDNVAIVGLGGLGHFGVLFSDNMGCNTTVISTSPGKEQQAKELGANTFIEATQEQLSETKNEFDVIINTAPANLDWDAYLGALRPKGSFVQVGASPGSIDFEPFGLFPADKKIVGSHIGSPSRIQEMLNFAATNQIEAATQQYNLENVNQALDDVRNGEARFRAVLTP